MPAHLTAFARFACACLSILCTATPPAFSQSAAAADRGRTVAESDAPGIVEEIIVRGQRLSEIEFDLRLYIQQFVEQVSAPARGRGFARWQRSVCVGVHNLQAVAAQYIVDRISALALEVGLEAGEPGCEPQVNIIFTANARETASLMVKNEPRLFRPVMGNAGMDRGLEALDHFAESDDPVRWWHVSMPVDSRTGAVAIQLPGQGIPWIAKAGPSRLYSGIRDDMLYVIIIVDSSSVSDTSWQQLGDYLAMVSLVQVESRANPDDFDSILNLFSNPAAYSGLTDWDLSYVRALYDFNQERVALLQGNEIVSMMARRERSEEDPE